MATHQSAVVTGPGSIELQEVPTPAPGPGEEVLLEVEAVGLCGTDLHVLDGSFPTTFPVVLGHEIAATITDLDRDDLGLELGQRVAVEPVVACGACLACRRQRHNTCERMLAIGLHRPGGLQRYLRVPASRCHPVGDLEAGPTALVETLSVSQRVVQRAGAGPGETVLVLGAGPIGLGAVIAATDAGADVVVLDRVPARRELARRFGAVATSPDLEELRETLDGHTAGDGPTIVIEASGSPFLAAAAVDLVATTGTIGIVGVSEASIDLPLRPFTGKEISIVGSRSTTDLPAAVELVRRRRDDVTALITHRFPLARTSDAFRLASEHPDQAVKVLVEP